MRTKEITITSKNQITLPADLVRKLNLTRNRRLQIRQKGDDIILTPLPSLAERLRPVWAEAAKQMRGKKPLTDAELKQAIRKTVAEHADK